MSEAIRLRDAFRAALRHADMEAMLHLLTDDVVLLSDGGGKAPAAINPLIGPNRVARFLIGIATKGRARVTGVVPAFLNGDPGFIVIQALAVETDGDRINAIYVMRNPDKLRAIAARMREAEA